MTLRESAISLLLRIYPATWRREFGAEFEDLLRRGQLSVPVMVNVIVGGMSERLNDIVRRATGRGEMADGIFEARYDGTAKIVSILMVALFVAAPVMAMGSGVMAVFLALVPVAVIGLSFAFSPRGYEISGGAFRVKRLIGDVVFPLDTLRFVRDATAADFWGSVRLWGSGGLFGYYGWFWSKGLGQSKWYVTDRSKAVVVTVADRVILVSPEDRDGFLAAIGRADSPAVATDSGSACGFGVSRWIALAVTAIPLALVAAAFLYAPGRPPVDLTRDSLVIHSRFYGMTVSASSVDALNVRVVDLKAEPGWKPVARIGGLGNRYYRAGNFRTASGRAIKLFTTGTQRLVLLPPSSQGGKPVLLDVAEPDQFAARVRREWTSGQR